MRHVAPTCRAYLNTGDMTNCANIPKRSGAKQIELRDKSRILLGVAQLKVIQMQIIYGPIFMKLSLEL